MRSRLAAIQSTINALTIRALIWICERVPARVRYNIAVFTGWVFSLVPGGMRRAYEDNVQLLLPSLAGKLPSLITEVFKNFSITLCDFFIPQELNVEVPDRAKLEELRKQNKGILMLTFHMGHWELGARVMQQWGWNVSAVYQPYRNKAFKRLVESHRAPGVNFIPVGGHAAQGVRDALRRGDMVAMLGDLPFGEEGIDVKLLNHHVIWPKGPILLAVREKCPIVVAVVVRTKLGHYRAFVEDPLVPRAATRAEVHRLVQEVTNQFAKYVVAYPSQWYRFRPFGVVQ
jgi:KDO2-lipid IV(A) lauroyltransferase